MEQLELSKEWLAELGLPQTVDEWCDLPPRREAPRRTDQLLAFCMSIHQRLGASSPARFLSSELMEHISTYLPRPAALKITRQSVHASHNKGYVLSNLRKFDLSVNILDRDGDLYRGRSLTLDASLVYEDGTELEFDDGRRNEHFFFSGHGFSSAEQTAGEDGRASFRLQLGRGVISSQHEGRKFRVRVALRSDPTVVVVTEPVYATTHMSPALRGKTSNPANLPPPGALPEVLDSPPTPGASA